jgi:hypothetical protein
MAELVFLNSQRATDWEGLALPGARAFFYLSGTTTPATVYADAALEIPHPTPLEADALGAFPAVWSDESLRLIVQDTDGQVLPGYPIDPVPKGAGTGNGASAVSFEPTPEIAAANVQAAVEAVRAAIPLALQGVGLGNTGDLPNLIPNNVNNTGIPGGVYRLRNTTGGTFPAGLTGEGGMLRVERLSASLATAWLFYPASGRIFFRPQNSTWGAWREQTSAALDSFEISPDSTPEQNSERFALLAAALGGREIDMGGQEIPVTAIPSGCRYSNGWFIVPDATGAIVRVPALDTVRARQAPISPGTAYEAWPQDNSHTFRRSTWQPYSRGSSHNADLDVRIAVSDDKGQTWETQTPTLPTVTDFPNRMVFSAGVVRGQQLMVVRYGNADNNVFRHKLFGRRLYERTQKTGVTITATTNAWTFGDTGDWGLKVGDQFRVWAWSGAATVGGQPVNATVVLTVTAVANSTVTVTRTGATAAPAVPGNLIFEPVQGEFAEITFGDGALEFGSAVLAAAGLTPGTDQPATLFHSFAPRDDVSAGGFYVGLHGGGHGAGAKLAFVQSVLHSNAATRTVAWVRDIAPEGVEPTVTFSGGWLYGTVRSQSFTGYPMRVWRSSNELGSAPVLIDAPSNAQFARRQPVPFKIIGGQAFLFFAGDRPNVQGARDVPLYLAVVPVAQLQAATLWPFRVYRVGAAYFSSTNNTAETNAVGLCSAAVLTDRKLFLSWSTENGPLTSDQDGQPQIWGAVLDVSRWVGLPPVTDAIGHLTLE